ncbi:MAG TPA: acetyl-CoA hydrolase/transferase C-terminal domain-containing protein [Bacillota bacterium]|nr:acetyl-CoA hydrolase/transferase C-terminal domain-containing protein [Bacillota bacterium]
MSLQEEYKRKLVSPEQAVQIVKSGDWVDYGAFTGQAVVLDRALAARKDELTDVKIRACTRAMPLEIYKVDPHSEHFTYNNWHFSGLDRKIGDQGACWYIPIFYHEIPRYYREILDVDVLMIPVAPMDEHGFFNFGPQVSHAMSMCDKAKKIILEVNPNIPKCLGGREEAIHISRVDYLVEADWLLPQIPPAPASGQDEAIASLIMNELKDGCCLQLGIGGMPNAVGMMIARSGLKDLGIHTEMFCDSMVEMVETGVVNGSKKQLDPGKIVYTFAMGTNKTYNFLNNNPMCAAYPVNYTNDPFIIGQNDNMVGINNCVEIDLFGQICSESSGIRHISGTGGQMCFSIGAFRSSGGKSFMCMSSTYKKGEEVKSRIKPILTPGAIVTTPRTMVSYIVTEHGMHNMKGMSTWQRAEAIISLADPSFREDLIKSAQEMGIWRRSNKRT